MKRMLALLAALAFSACALAAEVSPMTVAGATTVDVAKAKQLFDEGTAFVDVRSDKDWGVGRIPDAIHLELKSAFTAEGLGAAVPKDKGVVLYCNGESCLRSAEASEKAVAWGYKPVYYFRDGFPAWKSAGYPVE